MGAEEPVPWNEIGQLLPQLGAFGILGGAAVYAVKVVRGTDDQWKQLNNALIAELARKDTEIMRLREELDRLRR